MGRNVYLCCLVVAALAMILPVNGLATVTASELESSYGNKVLTLRRSYSGNRLRFDLNGTPEEAGAIGPWTTSGQLRVQQIAVKNGVIEIKGQRLFLFYDFNQKRMRDAGTLEKGDPASKLFTKKINQWAAKNGKVELWIECGMNDPGMADINRAMNAVFLAPDEPLTDAAPIFWTKWLESQDPSEKPAEKSVQKGESVERVRAGVTPPHVNYDPDPAYSEPARQTKYQGTTVLWLVIDQEGHPTHIRIQRALGMGLDEEAVAAVQRWKFDPAKRDGEPVPVMINVEVNFRLY